MSNEFKGKNPAIMFYPGDWFREGGLRGCSISARGAWIEILLTMHDTPVRGKLTTRLSNLSRMFAIPATTDDAECCVSMSSDFSMREDSCESLIKELLNSGVCEIEFDTEEDEKIFWCDLPGKEHLLETVWFTLVNRRMFRETYARQSVSQTRSEVGKLGGLKSAEKRAQSKQNQAKEKTEQPKEVVKSDTNQPNTKQKQAKAHEDEYEIEVENEYEDPNLKGYVQHKTFKHCWYSPVDVDQWKPKGRDYLQRCFEKLNGWIEQSRGDPLEFQKRVLIGKTGLSGAFQSWVFSSVAAEKPKHENKTNGTKPVSASESLHPALRAEREREAKAALENLGLGGLAK